MEKRAYTRQSVDFEVVLSTPNTKDQRCKVKDFCIGGMLLAWETKDVARNPNLTTLIRNDALTITIDVPASSGETKRYTLSAKAARISGTNMGISFVHPDTQALASIQQLARLNSQSNLSKPSITQDINPSIPHFNSEAKKRARSKYSETQERQILKKCLDLINDFFDNKISDYFKELDVQLQASIENAKDNAEQNELFDGINKFKKHLKTSEQQIKTKISQPFTDYALRNAFDLSHLRKDTNSNKIGLIDKEEFEDWLVVKVMATKVETSNTDALLELQLRFGELSGLMPGTHNNPIAPAVVCDAFNSVMTSLPIELKLRKIIYRLFENNVAAELKDLYKRLNSLLDSAGVLKDFDLVDHLGKIKTITGTRASIVNANNNAQSAASPSNALGNALRNTLGNASQDSVKQEFAPRNSHIPNQPSDAATTQGNFSGAHHTQQSQHGTRLNSVNDLAALENSPHVSPQALRSQLQAAHTANTTVRQFDIQQQIARNAADTVKRLISNHHHQTLSFQLPQADIQAPIIEGQALSKKLSELQIQGPLSEENTPRLSERVYQNLHDENGAQRSLGEAENAALNVIERLFDSILDIHTVGENVRPWIKRLEIPFLKLLMNDENFLQDVEHPARKVLNTIAKLGQSGLISNEQNIALIGKSLQSIVEGFDKDISVFNSANHELEGLLERQKKIFKKNIDRVQEAAQGQYKIKSAKRFVDSILENTLGGKQAPTALVVLLDAGWRELLNITALRSGTDSELWKEYEQVIYQLIDAANPKKAPPNIPALLKTIKLGLNSISHNGQFSDEKTITALGKLLKAERDEVGVYAPKLEIPIGAYDAQVLENSGIADDIWIRRAQKLQVGDWLEVDTHASIFEQELSEEDSNPEDDSNFEGTNTQDHRKAQMRLAWVDSDLEDFVFVNHQGMKIIDITVKQLAQLLREGLAQPIEDQDQPIVNLGLDRMVHKFYEQLVHHASHDELTGLMNRREFERQIKIALSDSRKNSIQHNLTCLDFNGVKQVNEQCGFEAGDVLLKTISSLIQKNTPKNTLIARIAGEQFALLLPKANDKTATILLNNLLKALSKAQFTWAEKTFPITCALGSCKITEHSESVSTLLKDALDACAKANLKGTHAIEFAEASNEKTSAIKQWEHRLSEAITQGRLTLRCQKIKALQDETIPDQYEILLSMCDESGKVVDTFDFIHAAECFEKMQLIDRWVIKNTLSWMQASPEKLSLLGNCSINLSSDSLNDESLLYYIFENLVEQKTVPRPKVCFEVTESTAVKNVADLADFVQEMKNIGCQFSLDDFGSESSSYGFLKNLSLNFVKIDGSFIHNLASNEHDYAMVKSINEMVHFMGKKTIAKQVEDSATVEKLKEIGVDFIQGYAVEAPIPLSQL